MKPTRVCHSLVAVVLSVLALSSFAGEPQLPPHATDATAKKYLHEIQAMIQADSDRVSREAHERGSARSDPNLTEQATRLVRAATFEHLQVVCEAATEATSKDIVPRMYRRVLVNAMNQRRDYTPEQKPIVLNFLPQLPELIGVIENMQWFDGAGEAIAAGWKTARRDETDGMLNVNSSRYARIAAAQGVTDALIAIARTVRNPNAAQRFKGRLLEQETAVLKRLLPDETGEPAALANKVVKDAKRLVFDPARKRYTFTVAK